eukprot:13893482-Alexandrium_andersonii.AAC.1
MPNGHYARWMPQGEAGYLLAMPYGHQRWMLLGNSPQRRADAGLVLALLRKNFMDKNWRILKGPRRWSLPREAVRGCWDAGYLLAVPNGHIVPSCWDAGYMLAMPNGHIVQSAAGILATCSPCPTATLGNSFVEELAERSQATSTTTHAGKAPFAVQHHRTGLLHAGMTPPTA